MSEPEKPQAEKFQDLARQLECDEDEAKFEDAVRTVAKPVKPSGEPDSPKDRGE